MTSSNFLGRSTARSAGKVLKNAERFFSAVPSAEGRFVAPVVVVAILWRLLNLSASS
jgi:hypothetical protein